MFLPQQHHSTSVACMPLLICSTCCCRGPLLFEVLRVASSCFTSRHCLPYAKSVVLALHLLLKRFCTYIADQTCGRMPWEIAFKRRIACFDRAIAGMHPAATAPCEFIGRRKEQRGRTLQKGPRTSACLPAWCPAEPTVTSFSLCCPAFCHKHRPCPCSITLMCLLCNTWPHQSRCIAAWVLVLICQVLKIWYRMVSNVWLSRS